MHCYHKTGHCQRPTIDFHLEKLARRALLTSPSEMELVFEKLESWMRFMGYPRKDLFAVTLALHEAATNAFQHGNRGDSSKYVLITYMVAETEVLVEVKDEGCGFDPDQVPNPLAEECLDRPGGRGLFMMRAYMSWVTFNQQGNRVTMGRWRSDV
jgi:serine/threonine-protein kinase RsbW